MISKKLLLFLVEGKNDISEIQDLVSVVLNPTVKDKYYIEVSQTHGDITTKPGINSHNVLSELERTIRKLKSSGKIPHGIKNSDFAGIIHILDMDGAYIPRNHIHEDDVGQWIYSDQYITGHNYQSVLSRNQAKKKVLEKLISLKEVAGISYRLYFVSCNMDHLLFGERNLKREEKAEFAKKFAITCMTQPENILSLAESEYFLYGDYMDSWLYVQEELNSLQRLTNVGIALKQL